jgi:hypothetical protein
MLLPADTAADIPLMIRSLYAARGLPGEKPGAASPVPDGGGGTRLMVVGHVGL